MAIIRNSDILQGEKALMAWAREARHQAGWQEGQTNQQEGEEKRYPKSLDERLLIDPPLARRDYAMAVRYSLYLMEKLVPGPGVELRVAPFGAIKILEGPRSDPHNLTPPDVIEVDPPVWLRLACGITTWQEEKEAGRIGAVGPRDDLSPYLPLPLD